MNRWGNDDRGPGGDPSWLGGKDRGDARTQGSGNWSSDFDSGAQGADSDFGGGRDTQAAEQMAPRFGENTGEHSRTTDSGADSPWMESFTGQGAEGSSGTSRSGLSRVLGAIVPIFALVIFGVVFMRIFSGGGFGGFSTWWILLFIGIPILSRVVRMVRKHLGG